MRYILAMSRWWSITALTASLSLLGFAHFLQEYQGLAPCHLCLKQRDIYWIAVGVSGVGSVWALFTGAKGPPRVISFVLFAVFFTGAAIAAYHAGAEAKWWQGPQSCTSDGSVVSLDDIAALMSGVVSPKPPQCDKVVWDFLGLSMAGWNAIISAGLAAISLFASMRLRLPRLWGKSLSDTAPSESL
jgi:disulfide bond formation protein DsbB